MAYNGWQLSDEDRTRLLAIFPAAYPDVIAHHVTAKFGARPSDPLPQSSGGTIVGIADDGAGVQALVVDMGDGITRPDGFRYHITWSIDRAAGRKPAQSKEVCRDHMQAVTPIVVKGLTPKFFG